MPFAYVYDIKSENFKSIDTSTLQEVDVESKKKVNVSPTEIQLCSWTKKYAVMDGEMLRRVFVCHIAGNEHLLRL